LIHADVCSVAACRCFANLMFPPKELPNPGLFLVLIISTSMHGILKQVFETGCPLGQDYEQPGQNLLFVQPVFIDVALISSSPFFAAPTLIRSQL